MQVEAGTNPFRSPGEKKKKEKADNQMKKKPIVLWQN